MLLAEDPKHKRSSRRGPKRRVAFLETARELGRVVWRQSDLAHRERLLQMRGLPWTAAQLVDERDEAEEQLRDPRERGLRCSQVRSSASQLAATA